MCPYSYNCKTLVAYSLVIGMLACSFKEEDCPYRIKEPDEPVKKFIPSFPPYDDNLAITTSANAAFIDSGIGEHLEDLPDGSKVFFIRPRDINVVGGTLKTIDKAGKEIVIKLEYPKINK